VPRLNDLPSPSSYDVVIVGGGPSGSSCAYWLARAGWRVCVIEKKTFPRVKTCGDGLTPRSVRQLHDMGLADELAAHGHRYHGLRSVGFGATLELNWPEHPVFPNYGYTITRYDLDGRVAERASEAGATVLTGSEAVSLLDPTPSAGALAGAAGVVVRDVADGQVREIRGRYVVTAEGQNARLGRELGVTRDRTLPLGMALRGYYTSERHDEPWIESHLDIRDPHGDVVPGYGWIFPLGDGRVNVGVGLLSTGGAWKGVNTTKLQEYFVAQVGDAWGLNESTSLGAPTGGRLPMGLALGPRVGANTLAIGDAAGAINPFNGEGIAYGYETGRLAAAVLGEALATHNPAALASYDDLLERAYGEYYRVAQAFVRLISQPAILTACVSVGLRVEPLMRGLLAIMANLMNHDEPGVTETTYRALVRLTEVIPESVVDRVLGDSMRVRPVATLPR
jgi:geranylgeranyl reductase family protein